MVMDDLELEYIDSVDRGSKRGGHEQVAADTLDSRLATVIGVTGWLIVAAAIVVGVALAVTYRPSEGDPMRPTQTNYVSERGVPLAADLALGTVGVVLGLGLVALGRLLVHSATMAARLTVIARRLDEQQREREPGPTAADNGYP
jgi:hypothetical protein